MASQVPTLAVYFANPENFPDYEITMDDAGKLKVVMTAEARTRNDRNVFTGIYKPGSGGFFHWISFYTTQVSIE